MKRSISFLLVLVVLLNLFAVTPVYAKDSKASKNSFYVVTEEVPQGVYDHIANSLAGMIGDLYDVSTLTVSKPFKLYNAASELYYSIICSNGIPVGMYRSYQIEGRYTGIFSENAEMASKLLKLAPYTSSERPATVIVGDYQDIYVLIENDVYQIDEDPFGNVTSSDRIRTLAVRYENVQVINISQNVDLVIKRLLRLPPNSSHYLEIGFDEIQGDQPWCLAYCTASIIRYKTGYSVGTVNAQAVMKWAFPNITYENLLRTSLSTDKAAEFAQRYNLHPRYVEYTRPYSQVKNEIALNSPILFVCTNLSTNSKHGIVCRGYDDNSGQPYYSYWNPWNPYYERIFADVPMFLGSNGCVYKWTAAMYGWK